jgi:hypothetical protein
MPQPMILSQRALERGWRWPMPNHEMLRTLGIYDGKLPKTGREPILIQGILVWVNPQRPHSNGRKTSEHRIMCKCPNCHKTLSVGRLHQHKCKTKTGAAIGSDGAPDNDEGWWQDPAGGWHAPDEENPAKMYE